MVIAGYCLDVDVIPKHKRADSITSRRAISPLVRTKNKQTKSQMNTDLLNLEMDRCEHARLLQNTS